MKRRPRTFWTTRGTVGWAAGRAVHVELAVVGGTGRFGAGRLQGQACLLERALGTGSARCPQGRHQRETPALSL